MRKIFWDLDGTILDIRQRLYRLFCELTDTQIGFEKYWQLKEAGYNQAKMLSYIGSTVEKKEFHTIWLANVERMELLHYDTLQPGIKEILADLFSGGSEMYIVTNRQCLENVKKQLYHLGINSFFKNIITTEQKFTKAEAVKQQGINAAGGIFIGDSKEDMQAALELNCEAIYLGKRLDVDMPGLKLIGCGEEAYGILNLKNNLRL